MPIREDEEYRSWKEVARCAPDCDAILGSIKEFLAVNGQGGTESHPLAKGTPGISRRHAQDKIDTSTSRKNGFRRQFVNHIGMRKNTSAFPG